MDAVPAVLDRAAGLVLIAPAVTGAPPPDIESIELELRWLDQKIDEQIDLKDVDEANRYEGRLKKGGILLSVHADDSDWKNKGKDILESTGAEDIGSKGESNADDDKSDRT